jgi:nitrite reductase/ring-hydroxylating ferredoxin subunit
MHLRCGTNRFKVTKRFEKVAAVEALGPGASLQVNVTGRPPIAIHNVDGTFYATADRCTHGNSSLAEEGFLEGHAIECGRHGGMFDVRTGAVLQAPCTIPLQVFEVFLEDDAICIVLDDDTVAG